MTLKRYKATRYETTLVGGRTHPLVLGCAELETSQIFTPKVVKAIGCPEVTSNYILACELIGNLTARKLGVQTPEPCLVSISPLVAKMINQSLQNEELGFSVNAGWAAGCELISMVPYTNQQTLTADQSHQAMWIYISDMLMQNTDRRRHKVNCGLNHNGIVAFDFEMSFNQLFLRLFGNEKAIPWEPSNSMITKDHLFHSIARLGKPDIEVIENKVLSLNEEWLKEMQVAMPDEWKSEVALIRENLKLISENANAFAKDIQRGLL